MLFVIATGTPVSTGQLAVLALDTEQITRLDLGGVGPRYLPTGHLVYVADNRLFAVPFNVARLEVAGNPVPVVDGVAVRPTGAAHYDVSVEGRLVYGSDGQFRRTLVWVDQDGTEEPIAVPLRAYGSASISPDGTQLALEVADEAHDIYLWDLRTENLTRFTLDAAEENRATWTPDGKWVVFVSRRSGSFALYRKSVDGTGAAERLVPSARRPGGGPHQPDSAGVGRVTIEPTPDGTHLIFNSLSPRGDHDLLTASLDGDHLVEVLLATEHSERNPVLSPNGRFLAYDSDESGQAEVYVVPYSDVTGRRVKASNGGGQKPLWAPDGPKSEAIPVVDPGDPSLGGESSVCAA